MTESMLRSLMKLFALLATINVEASHIFSKNFVETYLKNEFSQKLVSKSLDDFEEYLAELAPLREHQSKKRISTLSVKILMICNEINQELPLKSKYLILFSIIQFSKHFEAHSNTGEEFKATISDAVATISEALLINESEFRNCKAFIADRFYRVPDRSSLMVVSDQASFQFSDIRHMQKENLTGQFFFLKLYQADLYIFYYSGNEILELGNKTIFPNHVYVLPKGSAIKAKHIKPIYYSEIVTAFRRNSSSERIRLTAEQLVFRYPNSRNGIHELNLDFNAGDMVGIMGGSGTGKSTLMRLLNGTIRPDKGRVVVNGYTLGSDDDVLEGMIGFVPQDDLLIEELTVFENLYYNAKLCLGNLDEKEVVKRIGKVLNSLDLFFIKDLKVGSPLNKFISGGQRKRLNIALELIREPYILFVDEPTSGLSSTDSENVLTLLKEQALSGKIIVINIHQPSSELFKLFDRVVIMDKGGYPVYTGNPLDSVSYLKNIAHRADAAEIECETCGNVNTDDILKIIEAKKVNEFGEFTKERLMTPADWYELYKEKLNKKIMQEEKVDLPKLNFKIPSRFRQFIIYSGRNFFAKLADTQFVLLALMITPALALILGYFTKYLGAVSDGVPSYVFSLNENIPAYLFMCVIVALFVGMIISAEEIIRDRSIRSREAFLNLSRYSYLNSKIAFLFVLSAFQMFVFVLIGNLILEIKGLNLNYWLILFSTACFAVMLGLNISAGLKSIISIYINIPFILVPLILLSGVIVKYDKLHYSVAGNEYVPLVGDVMASRWAYEALVVNQFKNNRFEEIFFENDKAQANTVYNLSFLVPELKNKLSDIRDAVEEKDAEMVQRAVAAIRSSLSTLEGLPEELKGFDGSSDQVKIMGSYLDQWTEYLQKRSDALTVEKDNMIAEAEGGGLTPEELVSLKQDYHNESVSELALNSNEMRKIIEINAKIIRKDTPVFQEPSSSIGRAQFFASTKFIGQFEIDTITFNILVLWFMTIILYIALVNDWLRKVIGLVTIHTSRS